MYENSKKTEYIRIMVFSVIVLLQICILVYCFTVKKKNYHSDELFSYGLANSYYQPYINANDHEGIEQINNHKWLSGKIINNYLSVDMEQRFAYDSVYYNNSKDVHPPFYYMVLHTICSLFPEVFSKWFGFGINLVLFVMNQILIYCIVNKMTGNGYLSLIAVVLYGFNQGGINTYIFIRMYAMCTFFVLLCFFYHVKLYYEEDKKYRLLIRLAVITFLGGMTHYYYLVVAGVVSACFCIWYLIKKQYRFLAIYAVVMLLAAGMVIVAYPYVLIQLFRFEGNHDITSNSYGGFWFEWRVMISGVVSELSGINLSVMPTYFWIHMTEVLLVFGIVFVPACFLLRKETWFKNSVLILKDKLKKMVRGLSRINILHLSMSFSVVALLIVVAVTVPVYVMGMAATRYVFPIYPVLVVLFVLLLNDFVGIIWKLGLSIIRKKEMSAEKSRKIRKGMLLSIVLICLLIDHLNTRVHYYFDYEQERLIQNYVKLDELPRKADYIFVLREFWILNCLTSSFRDIDNFFATNTKALFYLENELNKLYSQNPMYLVMEIPNWRDMAGNDREELELNREFQEKIQTAGNVENERTKEILKEYESFFMKLDICECFEYIGNSMIYGREVFIFRLKS